MNLKMLFVSDSLPAAPQNGMEYVNVNCLRHFADRFVTDVLILAPHDGPGNGGFEEGLPKSIRRVMVLRNKPCGKMTKIGREVLGKSPMFFLDGFDLQQIRTLLGEAEYDVVWLAPVLCLGLMTYWHRAGLKRPGVVGLNINDVATTLYLDVLRLHFAWGFPRDLKWLWMVIRFPFLWLLERKYLKSVDVVHVQTEVEKERARKLLGNQQTRPAVVAAQMGKKSELYHVHQVRAEARRILYFAQPGDSREREAAWVITQIWPLVKKDHPDAAMTIAGFAGANLKRMAASVETGIEFVGYEEDIALLYREADVALVPTFRISGIKTRILDALQAGLPAVATKESLASVKNLVPGHHTLMARSAAGFSGAIGEVLDDADLREKLSERSKELAGAQPTWQESTETLVEALIAAGAGTVESHA